MDALLELCWSWSTLSSLKSRQRAAEASGWLDCTIDADGADAFEELYAQLAIDREKEVREAAQRAWKERRRRTWAEYYLSIVLAVEGKSNKEILDAWCYGDALSAIGDDSALDALHHHLNEDSAPPNLRYWIRRIWEQVKKNWEKTTQEWPEPWFPWTTATLIKGSGRLLVKGQDPLTVEYTVWSDPRAAPSVPPRATWGGVIWMSSVFWAGETGEATIELDSGRRGDVHIERTVVKSDSGTRLFFRGVGDYP
jgi:hypothetical protein